MTQLDDFTREALCAGDQPPPGIEDRVFAAIVGPAGGPGPDGGGGGASQAPAPGSGLVASVGQATVGYAVKVVAATLGLAFGGVALIAVSAAGVRAIAAKGSSDESSAASRPELAVAAQAPEPSDLATLTPEPAAASQVDEQAPEIEPAAAPPPAKSNELAATNTAEDSIEAELALMKLARESKDPKAALTVLEQHRKRFSSGVFAAEREVLRVEQLCALGRSGEAQVVADAFVREHPDNPLRSRVEPACTTELGTDRRAAGHRPL